MPSTDNQGSSSPFRSFGRSILSIRRDSNHSMDVNHGSTVEVLELDYFQRHVADQFHDLSVVDSDELLSIAWIKKLLDTFIIFQEEFRVIMLKKKAQICKPPLDRMVSECLDRSVKALDICNAARDGIEKIRLWQKHLEIVLCALDSRHRRVSEGQGQFRRAQKALTDLSLAMLDEKESGSIFSQRNRSFGRHNTNKDRSQHHPPGHSRSLSWSVSRSWSAAKQLQSIANGLIPPRANDIAATNGIAVPVYMMSCILMFVLWTLVAVIPCQDRGLNIHFSIPRQFSWGVPILSLYERITEEYKKREQRNSNGLLKEISQIEKCTRQLTDLVDITRFPLTEEQKMELEQEMQELALANTVIKNELDPLERQVREVFRKIMSCRTDGLELLG